MAWQDIFYKLRVGYTLCVSGFQLMRLCLTLYGVQCFVWRVCWSRLAEGVDLLFNEILQIRAYDVAEAESCRLDKRCVEQSVEKSAEWNSFSRCGWKTLEQYINYLSPRRYSCANSTPTDVVNRVRNGESIPYRPVLPESTDLGKSMLDIIRNCWQENPDHRPTFQQIRTSLRRMTNGE